MPGQEIVYQNTWYLPPQSWTRHDDCSIPRVVPNTEPKNSPFNCDFGDIPVPIFDYLSSKADRTAIRVVIRDNPEFFGLLAESDRDLLLLIFAHTLVVMLRDNCSRFQYGMRVDIQDEDCSRTLEHPYGTFSWEHVEYYFTLIKTGFEQMPSQPRYICNIRR